MQDGVGKQEESPAEGRYANSFRIGHNAFEFNLEFAQLYGDSARERLVTRIIITPAYARELLYVLQRSVQQYEDEFGPIPRLRDMAAKGRQPEGDSPRRSNLNTE